MSLASNVITFKPGVKPEGAVVADIENGYCKLANELLDSFCQLDISGTQFQLLMAIVRATYGYNKKADRVTNTYLAELTGISLSAVKDGLIKLAERNIIVVEKSGIMKLVSVNKTVSDWVFSSGKKLANTRAKATNAATQESQKRGHKKPETRLEGATNAATKSHERGHTKDNLNTTNKRQPTKDNQSAAAQKSLDFSQWPSMPSDQTLKDWFAMRKAKKALVSQTVINRMAKQLQIAVAAGFSVDDCLGEAVTRSWTGFDAEWLIRRGNQPQTRFPQTFTTGQNWQSGDL